MDKIKYITYILFIVLISSCGENDNISEEEKLEVIEEVKAPIIDNFFFNTDKNPLLVDKSSATIDQKEKKIYAKITVATIPENFSSIKKLIPDFKTSNSVIVSPKTGEIIDITKPVVFELKNEQGKVVKYSLELEIEPLEDIEILKAIKDLNPEIITWNFKSTSFEAFKESLNFGVLNYGSPYSFIKFEYNKIAYLTLSFVKINSLPKQIGDFSYLKSLFLQGNNLTSLPKEIGSIENLRQLIVRNNKLKTLSSEIGNLKLLNNLDFQKNELENISQKIGDLTNLIELKLNDNNLQSLPKELGNLKNLEKLLLMRNKNLSKIPKEVCDLVANFGLTIDTDGTPANCL